MHGVPAPTHGRVVTTEGFTNDPDLPVPEWSTMVPLGGLHVARHLDRFVRSLGLRLVVNDDGGDCVMHQLRLGYPGDFDGEARRYRRVGSASGLRRVLRDEPDVVPLLGMSGGCVGWRSSWSGVRLDRFLAPGRLFAIAPSMAVMRPTPGVEQGRVYVCAWQAPFPTHALLAWGGGARLLAGPVEIPVGVRQAAGWMFHTGEGEYLWGRWPVRDRWLRAHRLTQRVVTRR